MLSRGWVPIVEIAAYSRPLDRQLDERTGEDGPGVWPTSVSRRGAQDVPEMGPPALKMYPGFPSRYESAPLISTGLHNARDVPKRRDSKRSITTNSCSSSAAVLPSHTLTDDSSTSGPPVAASSSASSSDPRGRFSRKSLDGLDG